MTTRVQSPVGGLIGHPYAKSLILLEWRNDFTREKAANSGGIALVEYPPVPQDRMYAVERMVIATNDVATNGIFSWFIGVPEYRNIQDNTLQANFDIGEYLAPALVQPGQYISCQWEDLTPGTQCWVRIQYRAYSLQDVIL